VSRTRRSTLAESRCPPPARSAGLHDPIVDQEIWDRVQRLLAEHAQRTAGSRQSSDALLSGKLFDDRGNRMSATHASKRGRRWRYYVSQAILQGHKHEAGSVARVPALEIERRVAEAARAASSVYDRQRSIGWQSGPGGAIGPGARSDLPARLSAIDHDANLRTAVAIGRHRRRISPGSSVKPKRP